MRKLRPLLSSVAVPVIAGVLLATASYAQTVSPGSLDPSRRVETVGQQATASTLRSDLSLGRKDSNETFDDFAPQTPGDNDIGDQLILRQREHTSNFSVTADAFGAWTNNAAHVSAGEIDDWYWGWHAGVGWFPRIAGNLFGGLNISQEQVLYDKLEPLNFEAFEVTPGLAYAFSDLANTVVFVQYQYQRLTQDFEELMNRHSVRFGAQKTWLINRRHSIDTTLMGSWDFDNDVDTLKRNEYIADVAWRFKMTRKLELSLRYRYTLFDYDAAGRQDSLHFVGLNLEWKPRKWLALYVYGNYAFNQSNYDVYDYEAGGFGGGLGFRIKF